MARMGESISFPGLGECPIVSVALCLVAPPLFQWTRVPVYGFSEAFASELYTTGPEGPVSAVRDLVVTAQVDEVGGLADFRVEFARAASVWRVAEHWGRPAVFWNWIGCALESDVPSIQAVIDGALYAPAAALDEAIAERFALEDAGETVGGCRAC